MITTLTMKDCYWFASASAPPCMPPTVIMPIQTNTKQRQNHYGSGCNNENNRCPKVFDYWGRQEGQFIWQNNQNNWRVCGQRMWQQDDGASAPRIRDHAYKAMLIWQPIKKDELVSNKKCDLYLKKVDQCEDQKAKCLQLSLATVRIW